MLRKKLAGIQGAKGSGCGMDLQKQEDTLSGRNRTTAWNGGIDEILTGGVKEKRESSNGETYSGVVGFAFY